MKSLILKDLYNIEHNLGYMFFIMIIFAFIFIPTSGIEGYIFVCAVLCSTMIVTTFSFDDMSKWTRYAMVTPVSRKELVFSKFVVLAIFSAIGSLFGLTAGTIGGAVMKKITFDFADVEKILVITLSAWALAVFLGGISIPLVFKFGAEKGRILLLASFAIPACIFFCIYKILTAFGIILTDSTVFIMLCCSPIFAVIWGFIMYKISYGIFKKQEL